MGETPLNLSLKNQGVQAVKLAQAGKETVYYLIAFLMAAAMDSYSASDNRVNGAKIDGSVFAVPVGFEYRFAKSIKSAITLSLTTTAFSIPSSVQRITPALHQGLVGWRTYF